MIFDGHLDMSMNALDLEREQTWSVSKIRQRESAGVCNNRGTSTVSLPELREGNTPVVLSTLIARAKPWIDACREDVNNGDWPTQTMTHAIAHGQLAYYRLLEGRDEIRIITTSHGLREHMDVWAVDPGSTPIGVIITMEGADPITTPAELGHWYAAGVRTLMLAHFGKSHYGYGTPGDDLSDPHSGDGPLTDMGKALLPEMERLGMPLDLTHTSDQTFAQAAELFGGRIYSSHTCCRAISDMPRNHTDAQIQTVLDRDGVIGLPMFNYFLDKEYKEDSPKDTVTFDKVADHIDHICQLAGSATQVAIGSDADGGFGREHMPAQIDTHRDLHKLADTLGMRGYSEEDIAQVMCGNWMRFFSETLPGEINPDDSLWPMI